MVLDNNFKGEWVAQSAEHPTLSFGSVSDLGARILGS